MTPGTERRNRFDSLGQSRAILIVVAVLFTGALAKAIVRALFNSEVPGWLQVMDFVLLGAAAVLLIRVAAMQPVRAVAMLTWRAAFRFRLFWVLAGLLLLSVVALPLLLKNDGTARGFIQIMLTYTTSVVTVLLAFSTLWLSCGTLARDIEDCQMQIVAVKPIARWQIWVGKLIGITLLNCALLALSGASIYFLLKWRARQLPPLQQQILAREVFVARASLKEPAPDIEGTVNLEMQRMPNRESLSPEQLEEARAQLRERVKASSQLVPPNHLRRWTIDLGPRQYLARDKPLFLRIKFHVAQTNLTGSYLGLWQVGPPASPMARSLPQSLAANTFHEIALPPNLYDEKGVLTVDFENRNESALIFPLEDGFEVLYQEGGFGLNFVRGLGVILCWLTLVAILGLASASMMSFPVAAFFSISLFIVAMSSGTLTGVVEEGTVTGLDHETGAGGGSWLDFILLPLFHVILSVVNLVQEFSPVDALSTGRSITWSQCGTAFGQVVLLLGGVLAIIGITVFTRRELATAQSQH